MLLSPTELATAATISPMARNASTPTDSSTNNETGRDGSGMLHITWARPMISEQVGQVEQPTGHQ